MPVPASYNDIFPDREVRDHVGDVWYQRDVRVPAGLGRERIVLRFDAATHRATVWVGRRRRSPSTRAATRRSRPTSPRT